MQRLRQMAWAGAVWVPLCGAAAGCARAPLDDSRMLVPQAQPPAAVPATPNGTGSTPAQPSDAGVEAPSPSPDAAAESGELQVPDGGFSADAGDDGTGLGLDDLEDLIDLIPIDAADAAPPPAITALAPQQPGALVHTEAMVHIPGTDNEWLELVNTTDQSFDLLGCELSSSDDVHIIERSVHVAPGAYVVLGGPDAALDGVPLAYSYDDVRYKSTSDVIGLRCGDVLIDEVAYTSELTEYGESMQLDPSAIDAIANDNAAHWCISTAAYGSEDHLGSPGLPNHACPAD